MDSASRPTERFTGLAKDYALYRPSYPEDAIDYLVERAALKPSCRIADIGCGTGIASRIFAERGMSVVGIEPNDDMRRQALEHIDSEKLEVAFQSGSAECTGLEPSSMDLVLAAQAFHWFTKDESLHEFHRILKGDCYCALIWNERDEIDPFTRAYGQIVRRFSDAARLEVKRGRAGYALLASDLFEDGSVREFLNQQQVSEQGLLGRAFSTSYAPQEADAREEIARNLKELHEEFAIDSMVTLRYVTTVYMARKY